MLHKMYKFFRDNISMDVGRRLNLGLVSAFGLFLNILFISNRVACDEISEIKTKDASSIIAIKKNHIAVDLIVAGGEYRTDCLIFDQGILYLETDAQRSAKRRLIDGVEVIYGVPSGQGPIYPGIDDSCHVDKFQKLILWPTKGCGRDLSLKQALNYARLFNETVCGQYGMPAAGSE